MKEGVERIHQLVEQWSPEDLLRWAFFYLFLFAIGYSVGPQFFGSLKKDAMPQIWRALKNCTNRTSQLRCPSIQKD